MLAKVKDLENKKLLLTHGTADGKIDTNLILMTLMTEII